MKKSWMDKVLLRYNYKRNCLELVEIDYSMKVIDTRPLSGSEMMQINYFFDDNK